MKTVSILALLALSASLVMPHARADKETRALIGGLIGGALIGAALADDDVHASVSVSYGRPGYYEWVSVRTWVPGHYAYHRDHCGSTVRVWVSGHYTYVKEKVWVSAPRHRHPHHHGHYHRDRGDRRDRHDRYGHRYRDRDRRDWDEGARRHGGHRERKTSRRF